MPRYSVTVTGNFIIEADNMKRAAQAAVGCIDNSSLKYEYSVQSGELESIYVNVTNIYEIHELGTKNATLQPTEPSAPSDSAPEVAVTPQESDTDII